ncbi:MAG: hypothetical protein K6T61_18020 [Bryobacteraceae bacterium]|nr:hypothetical protein [Bryobacteraceae bacterium]
MPAICSDLEALLRDAPSAVNSFHPGHWELMADLEHRAREVVRKQSIDEAVEFLVDVAYLKRPHTVDRRTVRKQLSGYPSDIAAALRALCEVDKLDYEAMEVLARLPWFGRRGGRAFNSAVFRLVKPQSFGIIDWRNVAVLANAPGFQGLVNPPVRFNQFCHDEILVRKGSLPFTRDVYRHYNECLRSLARRYERTVAEIDLILWTYSIQRQPFPQLGFPAFPYQFQLARDERERLRRDHGPVAEHMVQAYLTRLKETGHLTRDRLLAELSSLFAFIRDECKAFGHRKRGRLKDRVNLVVVVLNQAIDSGSPERLLALWKRWQDMVDPSSRNWIGINLPTDMVLEGYMVLEDFIPVKRYIESFYDSETLEPTYPCD